MQSLIWISFDLGVRGDYEGMYSWLDEHNAKECGDSLATLKYEHQEDLIASLTEDIKKNVEIDNRTRIYVIWRDTESRKAKGCFIAGGRKAPPWAGHGNKPGQNEPDEE